MPIGTEAVITDIGEVFFQSVRVVTDKPPINEAGSLFSNGEGALSVAHRQPTKK